MSLIIYIIACCGINYGHSYRNDCLHGKDPNHNIVSKAFMYLVSPILIPVLIGECLAKIIYYLNRKQK